MEVDDQAVVADGDVVEHLVDDCSSLLFGGVIPDLGEVEVVEDLHHLLEVDCYFVSFGELCGGGFAVEGQVFDLGGKSGLFLSKLVAADLVLVVEPEELGPL